MTVNDTAKKYLRANLDNLKADLKWREEEVEHLKEALDRRLREIGEINRAIEEIEETLNAG